MGLSHNGPQSMVQLGVHVSWSQLCLVAHSGHSGGMERPPGARRKLHNDGYRVAPLFLSRRVQVGAQTLEKSVNAKLSKFLACLEVVKRALSLRTVPWLPEAGGSARITVAGTRNL